jgi:Lipopolysaccharide-assembly
MKKINILLILIVCFIANSCSIYNFTGTGKIDAKTYQVNNFINNAQLIEPGIERTFTQKLQNLIQNQTNLNLTNSGGDLLYEGEIIDYRISPFAATAGDQAALNRLNITINVRFTNKKKESENFEKKYTFFYDYPGQTQLNGTVLNDALTNIFDNITQNIFNDSLAKW